MIISAQELLALPASQVRVFDCSFDLMLPALGREQYRAGHIPGAVYAHLDDDLSARPGEPLINGGRHPLPPRERLQAWLQAQGVGANQQVVVYDRNGCNYCGRLWWLLRWLGHPAVAVLDGGWQAWQAAGGTAETGDASEPSPAAPWPERAPLAELRHEAQVQRELGQISQTLIDARGAPRHRGEVEPLDPVAGHIPGALNRPFTDNFAADGRFKPASELRAEFDALLAGRDAASVVHHCGSGVSAVPNLLAMELAGYAPTPLYAGSYSEWSRNPKNPCARG